MPTESDFMYITTPVNSGWQIKLLWSLHTLYFSPFV